MGIGLGNVVKVKTNKEGAMIPSELAKAIQATKDEWKIPLAVNATAGTTILGAFDDLDAISKVNLDLK
jgi:glutamate/tyrosine decarboxylase-like PLP-dependent enzyme